MFHSTTGNKVELCGRSTQHCMDKKGLAHQQQNQIPIVWCNSSSFSNRNYRDCCKSQCFENFHPIDLHKLATTLSSSKSSTCILGPIATRLLKEVLPLISNPLLNVINLFLVTDYVPQSFKVAVIKPLLKQTYRPRSSSQLQNNI